MPLVLLYAGLPAAPDEEWRWFEAGALGLLMVALAAAHRLSFLVGVAIVGLTLAVALLFRERRLVVRRVAMAAGAALVLCPGVAYDLITRSHRFGGTQGYKAYAATKVHLHLVVNDLTQVFAIVGLLAALVGGRLRAARPQRAALRRRPRGGGGARLLVGRPLPALVRADGLLRAAGAGAAHRVRAHPAAARGRSAAVAALALSVAVVVPAWGQARDVRTFYDFANPTTLQGLDAVAARLRPGDVVVTDRCWSFLAEWLLQAQTLPALDPADILPKAEVAPAAQGARDPARQRSRPGAGQAAERPLPHRGPHLRERQRPPGAPAAARHAPLFVSSKLVVMSLDRAPPLAFALWPKRLTSPYLWRPSGPAGSRPTVTSPRCAGTAASRSPRSSTGGRSARRRPPRASTSRATRPPRRSGSSTSPTRSTRSPAARRRSRTTA